MALHVYADKKRAEEACNKRNKNAKKYRYKVVKLPKGGFTVIRKGFSIF